MMSRGYPPPDFLRLATNVYRRRVLRHFHETKTLVADCNSEGNIKVCMLPELSIVIYVRLTIARGLSIWHFI